PPFRLSSFCYLSHRHLPAFPTRRSSDLFTPAYDHELAAALARAGADVELVTSRFRFGEAPAPAGYERSELFYPISSRLFGRSRRSEEHTSELQSRVDLVCRLLLEKKKIR